MMESYEEIAQGVTIAHGDCLELMTEIPPASVDMVLCDPPYMINTKSDGKGKVNPWADYCNGAFWYAEWMRRVMRLLKPTGCLWTFLSWRSIVTFQKAACDVGWPIESLLVWDKAWIGPGGPKGLRPSYELVALFAMDKFRLEDRGLADVQRFPWSANKPHGHPAEKPETLLQWIVEKSTAPGATVADIFMGSGSTGAACIHTKRDFIGIELEDGWYEVARRRLMAEASQGDIFDLIGGGAH